MNVMSPRTLSYEQRLLQQTQELLAEGGVRPRRSRRKRLRRWVRRLIRRNRGA